MSNGKTLKLTLSKQPFEVMVTGEKSIEYRKPTKWIESRLIDFKTGDPKEYEFVEFTNGSGANKPYFKAKFLGWESSTYMRLSPLYSNNLQFTINNRDYQIYVGEVLEIRNYPS